MQIMLSHHPSLYCATDPACYMLLLIRHVALKMNLALYFAVGEGPYWSITLLVSYERPIHEKHTQKPHRYPL